MLLHSSAVGAHPARPVVAVIVVRGAVVHNLQSQHKAPQGQWAAGAVCAWLLVHPTFCILAAEKGTGRWQAVRIYARHCMPHGSIRKKGTRGMLMHES